MGFAGDLRAEDCSNLVIGANAFDRNPGYDYGRMGWHVTRTTAHDRAAADTAGSPRS